MSRLIRPAPSGAVPTIIARGILYLLFPALGSRGVQGFIESSVDQQPLCLYKAPNPTGPQMIPFLE